MTIRTLLVGCSAGLIALTLVCGPAEAQRRTTFNPYLYLEQTYTDNARFSPVSESDTYTRAAVVLPLTYDMRRQGSLFASYEYFVDRFSDLDDLDNEGQRFNVGYTVKPSSPSVFRIGASYLERTDQGRIPSQLVEDFFLTPRLKREVLRVGASYRHRLSQTWSTAFGVTYVDFDFERASSSQNDIVLIGVQSRDGLIYDFTIENRQSERSTVGLGYTYSDFTLDPIELDPRFNMEGDEQIHTLFGFWRYTVGPLWRTELRLGYYDRQGTNSDGSPIDRDGASARFSAFRNFRTTQLELFAGYAPSSEGILRGTSTVTTVGSALRDVTPGRWDWEVYARASRRRPANPGEADIDVLSTGGYVQWHLQRLLTLRLHSFYSDQTSDDFFSNRSVFRISLGLYWFPLGRTQIGGAPAVPFADIEE